MSNKIIVLPYQSGVSVSKIFVKWSKNRVIILESVLEWLNVNQTYPSVSSAAIIDNLGYTEFNFMLPLPSLGPQVFLVWLVSLIHVSSIFMILIPSLSFFIKVKAYYYLNTNDRSELAYGFSFLVLMKLNLKSVFSTSLISF